MKREESKRWQWTEHDLKAKREMIWREECKNRLTTVHGKWEIGQANKNDV